MHDLVQAGKVKYIGASLMRCWHFAMMSDVADRNGWVRFVSMSDEYSLLYREVCPLDMVFSSRPGVDQIGRAHV